MRMNDRLLVGAAVLGTAKLAATDAIFRLPLPAADDHIDVILMIGVALSVALTIGGLWLVKRLHRKCGK